MNKIRKLFYELRSSLTQTGSFTQNFAVVLSGTGLNIVIQIIVAPLLTRIYGPEAYGVFSLFNAFCTNIALIATLRLPQALLLPANEREFHVLMRVCLISSAFTSFALLLALAFGASSFLALFQAERLATYYYLIPIMVFLISMNQVIGQWQYRLSSFKRSVALDTGVLIGVRLFNLSFGWATSGATLGLVVGDMLGKSVGLFLSWRLIIKDQIQHFFSRISWAELKGTLQKFKQYPLFNLPGVWFTMLADQLSVFFVSSAFGLKSVGVLSLSVSMLDLPKRLLAYSANSVFYKRAVELHQQSLESLQKMVVKMIYSFLVLSLLPYGMLAVFGIELFVWVFGAEWEMSGQIAQYFSYYCILELLYFSLDPIYYVLRKEKRLFVFQAATFCLRFTTLFFGIHYYSFSFEECIAALAMVNTGLYSAQLSYLMFLLKLKWWKHLMAIFVSIAVFILLLFAIRGLF